MQLNKKVNNHLKSSIIATGKDSKNLNYFIGKENTNQINNRQERLLINQK